MVIIPATKDHAEYIAKNMRDQDIVELSHSGKTPIDGLLSGLSSKECFTVVNNDVPVMMFGLEPTGLLTACVWALGTDGILGMKKDFIRESLAWRNSFLSEYDTLYNYVDINNKISIRWLEHLGATFSNPAKRGKGLFMRFEFNV